MNDPDFQRAYEEQNRRDYIARATLGAVLSITLNLFCSIIYYFMYREKWLLFLKVRVCSVILVVLVWAWFRTPMGRPHYRIFGVTWYLSPLAILL